ncbi:hypothetical protein MP228_002962 [Amoeboaphelidium protococcarum]|nr:hypothetical protein MP228_002962 [Amoeboaphelidium protococcarum]
MFAYYPCYYQDTPLVFGTPASAHQNWYPDYAVHDWCLQPQRRRKTPKRRHRSPQYSQQSISAASVIQRAYRSYTLRKRLHALAVIRRFLDRVAIKLEVQRQIISPLMQIQKIQQELNDINDLHCDVFWGNLSFINGQFDYSNANNKSFLLYEDKLTKLLLRLDSIQSNGREEVQTRRKAAIKKVQQCLTECDNYRAEQMHSAMEQ